MIFNVAVCSISGIRIGGERDCRREVIRGHSFPYVSYLEAGSLPFGKQGTLHVVAPFDDEAANIAQSAWVWRKQILRMVACQVQLKMLKLQQLGASVGMLMAAGGVQNLAAWIKAVLSSKIVWHIHVALVGLQLFLHLRWLLA